VRDTVETVQHADATAPSPVVPRVHHLIQRGADLFGDAPFLLRATPSGWEGYSYRGAARAAHAFARLLQSHGVRPGSTVGLMGENRPEWGLAYLAILEAGAIVVPLDMQLTPAEAGELLATAEASHCVITDRSRATLEEARRARLAGLVLASLDDDTSPISWAEAQRRFPDAGPLPDTGRSEDVAALLFTSGTTGRAKGVMLTHSNLVHNVEAVEQTLEFGPTDRMLSVLPLHHTFECTGGLLCPMRVGASVAYARSLKSSELREDLESSGATILLGVPLLWEKLLAAIHRGVDQAPSSRRAFARALLAVTREVRKRTGLRIGGPLLAPLRRQAGLPRIRLLVSGAAALPTEVFWGFVDLGLLLLEGYGLTECAPVVAANRPARPEPGTVGWPIPGVEVRLGEPDEDGDGEILVRGPNVMKGYFRDPELTASVLRDGWFATGDLGHFLPDGRLRISGRLKNMIATAAGKKIYPEEVEEQIANSPYVVEVVVSAGRDARGEREEVHAHVFPDLGRLEDLAQVEKAPFDDAFVERVLRREVEARTQNLAPYKRPKRVIVRREEFTKTTTGKIHRHGGASEEAVRSRRASA
jgi:long-chain acyl-CoA synthetase